MTHTFSDDIVGCTRVVLETCLGKQYYDLTDITFDGGSFILIPVLYILLFLCMSYLVGLALYRSR